MPTYQYACTDCGQQLERVQSFSDPALTECPACEGKLRKVFNSVGIVFKGSGFYRTDSRAGADKANGSSGDSDGAKKSDGATKTDGAKSESASSNGKSNGGSSSSDSSTSGSGSSGSGSSGSGSGPGTAAKPAKTGAASSN